MAPRIALATAMIGGLLFLAPCAALPAGAQPPTTAEPASTANLSLREAATRARALVEAERFADAIPYQERALAVATRKFASDDPRIGNITFALARSHFKTWAFERAQPLARDAVARREIADGADHRKVAGPLVLLGRIQAARARFDDAERSFRRALGIRERHFGVDHPSVAKVLQRLAALQRTRGLRDEAEALSVRALSIVEASYGADDARTGDALNALAHVLRKQGRYVEAEPLYKRALAIREATSGYDHPKVSTTLASLALNYERQGRLAASTQLYERALSIREEHLGAGHPSVAMVLSRLATLHIHAGRYEEAQALATRALAITETALGPDHLRNHVPLETLAQTYRRQGRHAEAQRLLERSLAIKQNAFGAEHPGVASTLTRLALLARDLGQPDEAERLMLRAIAIARTSGANAPELVSFYAKLARLYRIEGRWDEALDASREATALMRARIENPGAPVGVEDLAGGLESEQSSRRGVFVGHVNALERGARDVPSAVSEAFEVAQLAQATGSARAIARMATRFASGSSDLARLVRERQDTLEQWRVLDGWLTEVSTDTGETREPVAEASVRESLRRLEQGLAALDARIASEYPDYRDLALPGPLSLEVLRPLLEPGEALISFLFANKHGYAWVVRRDEVDFRRLKGMGAETIAGIVFRLRAGLDVPGASTLDDVPRYDTALAFDAYRALLGPFEESLEGVGHLVVVADGALQSLPIGVLVTDAPPSTPVDGDFTGYREVQWLARRYAISVLPSVSSLRSLRALAAPPASTKPFAGFGDPALSGTLGDVRGIPSVAVRSRAALADVETLRGLPELPDTAAELLSIAHSLGADDDSVRLRRTATEGHVKRADLASVRVLAFATHGLLAGDLDSVVEPSLVLTPPAVATEFDDGLLTMSEVAQLELDADWVILSACNTAGADGTPGAEGLSGLARAFFYAGSRALLVSHWPVDSDAAVRLTTGTLAASAANPRVGRAEALRRSMLSLVDEGRTHYAHPLFWAPFSLVGEGGR